MDLKSFDLRKFAVIAAVFIALMSIDLDRLSDTRPLEFGSSKELIETLNDEGVVACGTKVEGAGVDDVIKRRHNDATTTVIFFDDSARKESMLRDPESAPGPTPPYLVVGRTWIITASNEGEAKRIADTVGGYVDAASDP